MTTAPIYSLTPGETPLLISVPHAGTAIPQSISDRLVDEARGTPDADWHVDRLYGFARELGAGLLVANYARYVIDLNRPPDDQSLYPGQATTGLCPTEFFDGRPLYRAGQEPDADERAERRANYWQPYHDRLAEALADIRARHGHAILYDAHSIRSVVPRLFDGQLPDLNLGTAKGESCAPGLTQAVAKAMAAGPFSHVVDGRFVGGYITRHYGRPADGIHALQMELAQRQYMDEEPPFTYRPERAERLQATLRDMLQAALGWRE
jgi:N-formylglutamate amidohydrolase